MVRGVFLGFAVLLIVLFVAMAIRLPFSVKGWKRVFGLVGCILMVVGALGFFGPAIAAYGGLNWVPTTFEFPAGYCSGVISTPSGRLHLVPLNTWDRVQLYDSNWLFVRGWHVESDGKPFVLNASDENDVKVITSQYLYEFQLDGTPISSRKLSLNEELALYNANLGQSVKIPTAFWLWPFSSPVIAWCAVAASCAVWCFLDKWTPKKSN